MDKPGTFYRSLPFSVREPFARKYEWNWRDPACKLWSKSAKISSPVTPWRRSSKYVWWDAFVSVRCRSARTSAVQISAFVDGVAFVLVDACVIKLRVVVFVADHALIVVVVLVNDVFLCTFDDITDTLPLLIAVLARSA